MKAANTLLRLDAILQGCRGRGDRRKVRDEPTAIEGVLAVLATTSQSGADRNGRDGLAAARSRGWVGSGGGLHALVPGRSAVDTHGRGNITLALLETRVVVGGHVLGKELALDGKKGLDVTYPVASHDVVDVVAELLSTGTEACANAELLLGDKFGPFVVLHALAEGVAVEEATNCAKIIISSTRSGDVQHGFTHSGCPCRQHHGCRVLLQNHPWGCSS